MGTLRIRPERSGIYERYALGLARKDRLSSAGPVDAKTRRCDALLKKLLNSGIKGWPDRMTLYTRTLPHGCRPCLQGQGSNLCLTNLCNRDCFFCFNPKPRADEMSVHGRRISRETEIPELLRSFGVTSIGLSGGEPLLEPERVLRLARRLRRSFGAPLRIDLYTNGDLLTLGLLRQLKRAGVDALRMNLAANDYDTGPLRLAMKVFQDVEVEIPTIPEHKKRLQALIRELDRLGAKHLILHELFWSAHNLDRMKRRGYQAKTRESQPHLTWSAVSSSEETALEILAYALRQTRSLSVYYCSCATQEWIAQQALARSGKRAAP